MAACDSRECFFGTRAMVPKRSPKKCGPGLRTACEPMVALGLVTPRGLEPPTETWQGLGAGSCVLRGWGWAPAQKGLECAAACLDAIRTSAPPLKPRERGIGGGRGVLFGVQALHRVARGWWQSGKYHHPLIQSWARH